MIWMLAVFIKYAWILCNVLGKACIHKDVQKGLD